MEKKENDTSDAESSKNQNFSETSSHSELESSENPDIQPNDNQASPENQANGECFHENSSESSGNTREKKLNDDPLQPVQVVNSSKDLKLPSEVTDRDYIFMPCSLETSMSDEVWRKSGKWMWFCHGDLTLQNRVWRKLQGLVEDGTFIGLKASTAKSDEGVINCYTADAENRTDVKKAADALRGITLDNYLMYYKTNENTMLGKYRETGSKYVSKYMHTVMGKFYERDEYGRWTQVDLTP